VRRIGCPHCHDAIELVDDHSDEVLCPSCGSSFLVRDTQLTSTLGSMRRLGRFQLLDRVGVGAFGTVWRARDTALDRMVALKIPHASLLTDPADLERFHREARAAAHLRHPGIVTVHEVTTFSGGLPAIVADFIEGITLRGLEQVRRLTFRESATLVAEVAEALHYAHELGLVHRDIKPANIMVEYINVAGRSASGTGDAVAGQIRPLLMDFGLALRDTAETTMTLEGQIIGTPAYMSPEQAAGHGHRVDRRSDVYSLGVVLYELLCGELPFRGSATLLRNQVLYEEPRAPRRIHDKIPRDLQTICLKAMAKEPHRRFQSAADFARDLRRFLNGEPIEARPVGKVEKLWRWSRRNPAVATLTTSLVLLLILIALGSSAAAIRLRATALTLRQERNTGLRNWHRAESAEKNAAEALGRALLSQAHANRWSGRAGRRFDSLKALTDATRIARDLGMPPERILELRNEAIACMALVDLRVAKHWEGFPPGSSAFGMDAKLERYARSDEQGNITIRRVLDDQEIHRLPGSGIRAQVLQFNPCGRFLAAVYHHYSPKDFWIWDVDRGQAILKLAQGDLAGIGFAFSPDGQQVAVGQPDGTIYLYDFVSGKELKALSAGLPTHSMRFHPNGRKLAVSSLHSPPGVQIRDLDTNDVTALSHPSSVRGLAWSADGELLATACDDWKVYLWDVAKPREPLRLLTGHQGVVVRVAFCAAGDLLASQSWDGTTRLWDPETGRQWVRADGTGADYTFQFSPDDRLLSCGRDGSNILLWEIAKGQECRALARLDQGQLVRRTADFSPDDRLLVTPGDDGVFLYDVANAQELVSLSVGQGPIGPLAQFHPDGSLITFGTQTGLRRWPITSDAAEENGTIRIGPPQVLELPSDCVPMGMGLSLDGTALALANRGGQVMVFDLKTQTREAWDAGYGASFIAISPDAKWIATGTWQGTGVKVWDAQSGQLVHELPVSKSAQVGFSPDGQWLVTGTGEEFRFWQVTSWRSSHRVLREVAENLPGGMAFTPDGTMLAIAHSRAAVKLIDPATGTEFATLPTSGGPYSFSHDGSYLATAGENAAIQVWDLRLIRQQLAGMNLDWDLPPYPAAAKDDRPRSLSVHVHPEPITEATR
jgi:WD40 repeat protein/serine/threonine protein kinase